MQFLSTLVGLVLLAVSVIGAAVPSGPDTVNTSASGPSAAVKLPYSLTEAQWNVTLHGIPFHATGDILTVYKKFYARHPEITPINVTAVATAAIAQNIDPDNDEAAQQIDPDTATKHISERNKSNMYCWPVGGWGWQRTLVSNLEVIIWLMKNIEGGHATTWVNGRSCVRAGCNAQAAVVLCNDNNWPIAPSSYYLATYADDIVNSCTYWFPGVVQGGSNGITCGQEFDTDNYNVIVLNDNTC